MHFSEDSSTTTDTDAKNADNDTEYAPSTSSESHFPTKKELDDLIQCSSNFFHQDPFFTGKFFCNP